MKEKLTPITLIILVLLVLIGGLTWLNSQLISRVDAGEQFIAPWLGARAFLFEQTSPYITPVAERVQVAIYGHYAQGGAYPHYLDIPFYKLIFYFPFALIKDFALALALWMSAAQIALFGVGFLSIHLAQWKPAPLNAVLFYLTLLFSFYGLYPVVGGSGAIFAALLLLLALLAIREGRDEALGILLVFGSFHLAKGGLVFILLLFWLYTAKRSRAISVAAMSFVTVFVGSFLLLPSWFMSFLGALLANSRADYGFLFSDFLQLWQLTLANPIAQILRWILIVMLLFEWGTARGKRFEHLLWAAAFSAVVVPFLNIHVSPFFYTLFFLPIALIGKIAEDRWPTHARWLISLFFVIILAAWELFPRTEDALQTLTFLLPALLLVALYWLRWWYLRAPRTWVDEANKFQR